MAKITCAYNGHSILVKNGIWERVIYDGRRVCSGWPMFGKLYTFSTQEGKETANYSVRTSSGLSGASVTVMRNGMVIYSDDPKNPVQTLPSSTGASVVVKMPQAKKSNAGGIGGGVLLICVGIFATQTVPSKEKHNEALNEALVNMLKRTDFAPLALFLEQKKEQGDDSPGDIPNYADIFGLTYKHNVIFSQLQDPKSSSAKEGVLSWGLFNNAHVNEKKLAEFLERWWNGITQ